MLLMLSVLSLGCGGLSSKSHPHSTAACDRTRTLLESFFEQSHLSEQPLGHQNGAISVMFNCDCHRRPKKSCDFGDKVQQCHIAISGCDGTSLAIAISTCDLRAANLFFFLREWGRVGPATSAWSPPGNGSQLGCVFVRCADVSVVSVCMITVILFIRLVWSL